MAESALMDKLLQGQFYPPIYHGLFEYGDYGIKQISEQFISNVQGIEGGLGVRITGHNLRIADWILLLLKDLDISSAFFGRAVYGEPGCGTKDLEVLEFVAGNRDMDKKILVKKPYCVTLLRFDEVNNASCIGNDSFEVFVSGPLIALGSNQFSDSMIKNTRMKVMGDMDAESFVFSLIPHAAAKIVNQQELDYLENKEHQAYLKGKILSSRQDLFMDLGQQPTIRMTNDCYMRQMACMDEPELTALAKAALKRIRVKEEHREMLAKSFVEKVKKGYVMAR